MVSVEVVRTVLGMLKTVPPTGVTSRVKMVPTAGRLEAVAERAKSSRSCPKGETSVREDLGTLVAAVAEEGRGGVGDLHGVHEIAGRQEVHHHERHEAGVGGVRDGARVLVEDGAPGRFGLLVAEALPLPARAAGEGEVEGLGLRGRC